MHIESVIAVVEMKSNHGENEANVLCMARMLGKESIEVREGGRERLIEGKRQGNDLGHGGEEGKKDGR